MYRYKLSEFDEKSDTAKTSGIQADISALVEDIGYTPRIPFEQGVQDMVMYIIHKNNIKRTYSQNEHTCFDNFISRT
jgi:nucleoside-diphosphate-sugar epimerase